MKKYCLFQENWKMFFADAFSMIPDEQPAEDVSYFVKMND